MIEKAHKHSTVNAENVEIVTVAGNLNRSSARKPEKACNFNDYRPYFFLLRVSSENHEADRYPA